MEINNKKLHMLLVSPALYGASIILIWIISAVTRLYLIPLGLLFTMVMVFVLSALSFLAPFIFEGKKTSSKKLAVANLVVSVLIVYFIANRGDWLGYEVYRVPSNSMANTLLFNDFILADSWVYRDEAPKRKDLVVFKYPKDPSVEYVKRVIGMPNEVVKIVNGIVYVDDKLVEEQYVSPENNRRLEYLNGEYLVPSDNYFLMGDNRDHSNDSRFWGFVPVNNIYAKVKFIWMSYDPRNGIRNKRIGNIVK